MDAFFLGEVFRIDPLSFHQQVVRKDGVVRSIERVFPFWIASVDKDIIFCGFFELTGFVLDLGQPKAHLVGVVVFGENIEVDLVKIAGFVEKVLAKGLLGFIVAIASVFVELGFDFGYGFFVVFVVGFGLAERLDEAAEFGGFADGVCFGAIRVNGACDIKLVFDCDRIIGLEAHQRVVDREDGGCFSLRTIDTTEALEHTKITIFTADLAESAFGVGSFTDLAVGKDHVAEGFFEQGKAAAVASFKVFGITGVIDDGDKLVEGVLVADHVVIAPRHFVERKAVDAGVAEAQDHLILLFGVFHLPFFKVVFGKRKIGVGNKGTFWISSRKFLKKWAVNP